MAGLEDEWQETDSVITPATVQNSQHRKLTRSRSHDGDSSCENRRVIRIPSIMVGRVIGKGGSKIRELINDSKAYIRVGNSSGSATKITLSGSSEAIIKAQLLINKIIGNHHASANTESNFQNNASNDESNSIFFTLNDQGVQVTDWEKLYIHHDNFHNERLANLPPIVKDFYREDPSVSNMSAEEVTDWRHKNFDMQVKRTFGDHPDFRPIPNPVLTFEQAFKDYREILNVICKQGFKVPTPIQSQSWPILLRGEDLIVIAPTGTGKIFSFLLPAFIHIEGQTIAREDKKGPTVLILVPTKELVFQIQDEVSDYQNKDIKSICMCRGGDEEEQIKTVDIVIATPGRLCKLILAHHLHSINFSYIVLHQADRLLDMGFEIQIRKSLFNLRPDRQTVMTSATWPARVSRLVKMYMKNPIQINAGSLDLE